MANVPPGEKILHQAKDMLLSGNYSDVQEVADALGFHLVEFAVEFHDYFNDHPSNLLIKADKEKQKMEHIAAELRKGNYPGSIEKVARGAFMCTTKVKSKFKAQFGTSIYNYYHRERLRRAADLLKTEGVGAVGKAIGYANLSQFGQAFKKEFGHLPEEYKRQFFS